MKQNIKRISFILIIFLCIIVCASCKKCSKCSKDPTTNTVVVPSISNPNETFIKIGNFNITNNDAYFQMVNSFGLETLMNVVDKDIIPSAEKDAKFDEFLDNIIYGEEEKTDEKFNEFIEKLPLSGLNNVEGSDYYYVDYYFQRYSRIQYAKKIFKETKASTYFTETQLKNTFNELFSKKENMIVLNFDSAAEARKVLDKHNINLNLLNNGWHDKDGNALDNEKVKEIFTTIYADYHQGSTDAVKEYTYSDLHKINTALLLDVYYMDANSYTKTIKTYNGKAYLVYKDSETGNLDESGNEVTFTDKQEVVINHLIDETIDSTYATSIILAQEIKAGLTIYDKGLENTFSIQYDYVNSSIGLSENDIVPFTKTTQTSETNILSYNVNGQTKYVSADTFFSMLTKQYGAYLSALYMKQYLILKDNAVLSIEDFKVLDQTKYDKYYKNDITTYKDKFLAEQYASLGYPSSYGWDNFVRDYLGLLSDNRILINLDSSLYEECIKLFKEDLFIDENGKDTIIQEEMEKIVKDYLYASTLEIRAYYDVNLDGTPDELVAGSEKEQLARKLISKIFEKMNNESYTSVTTKLNEICDEYRISTVYNNNTWKEFKQAGLKLEIVSSKTYTANSNADETTINQLKRQYDEIINFKNDPNHVGVNLSGIDLSTYYRNSKLDAPINALSFVDASCTNLISNAVSCYIITKAYDHAYINESTLDYKPTFEDYKQYYEDSSKQSNGLKNCITNFYLVAINNVVGDDVINETLLDKCLLLLKDQVTYSDIQNLTTYINACKSDLSE